MFLTNSFTTPDLLWITVLVFLLAGTIKGTIGIGLPTASVSILSQFYDPRTAIVLVMAPMLVSNIWQVYRSKDYLKTIRTYWPFALMLMVFIWLSARFSVSVPTAHLMMILGTVIILFSLNSLFLKPPRLPPRHDKWIQPVAGALAGLMGGLTAIWSPPMVIYLLARGVGKDGFVRATGLLISLGSLPLMLGYWSNGLLRGELAQLSAVMIVPTLLGFGLGELLRRRIDAALFQKVVLTGFLLMGLNIIRRGLFG